MRFEEINRIKNIKDVKKFLIENKNSFLETVDILECRKWSKWVTRNEIPFPCVCPKRNQECIFAETYYELFKVAKISNFEKKCEEAILDFQIIKNENVLIKNWLNQYNNLHSDIFKYRNIITIKFASKPYEKLTLIIGFPAVIEDFKTIYLGQKEILNSY